MAVQSTAFDKTVILFLTVQNNSWYYQRSDKHYDFHINTGAAAA